MWQWSRIPNVTYPAHVSSHDQPPQVLPSQLMSQVPHPLHVSQVPLHDASQVAPQVPLHETSQVGQPGHVQFV